MASRLSAVVRSHFISLSKAAKLLGVSESTLTRMADAKEVPARGGQGSPRLFPLASIRALAVKNPDAGTKQSIVLGMLREGRTDVEIVEELCITFEEVDVIRERQRLAGVDPELAKEATEDERKSETRIRESIDTRKRRYEAKKQSRLARARSRKEA